MPVNGKSSVSTGRWAQVSKNWQTTVYPSQSPSSVPHCDTISSYTLPVPSQLSTGWSPVLCLVFVPTNPHAYTLAKPGYACFLKRAWPLPHPWPQLSHCQKRSPPASSSVKTPLTFVSHIRPGIPWSKSPPWAPPLCMLTPFTEPWGPWFVLLFRHLFLSSLRWGHQWTRLILSPVPWAVGGWGLGHAHPVCLMVLDTWLVSKNYCLSTRFRTVLHIGISAIVNHKESFCLRR